MSDPEPAQIIEARRLAAGVRNESLKRNLLANAKQSRCVQVVPSNRLKTLDVLFGDLILSFDYNGNPIGFADDQRIVQRISELLKSASAD